MPKAGTSSDHIDPALPTAIVSLQVIQALAQSPQGLGVTQLSQHLGIPKARTHRHLSALREHGYLVQDPRTNQYRVGWQLYLLGMECVRRFDLTVLAQPALQRLRDTVGQTVVIASYSEQEVVVIDVLRGTSPLAITLRPGSHFGLNSSAQGKLVLSYGPPALRTAYLSRPLPQETPHTISTLDQLHAELDLVRKRGWADAPEELFTGINAVAAPLLQTGGNLFGTLALVGSIHYLPATPDPVTINALRRAAGEISTMLGYTEVC